MTDLIVRENNLPTTLEDLSAFVLFNDEKVKAVRAALSAMHKLKAPRDVLDLKLREAQELSEQVALAKIELGKRISELPKVQGTRTDLQLLDTPVEKLKPKSEAVAQLGLTQKQAERFQQMAKNPDAVQAAIDYAEDNDTIATRTIALTTKSSKPNAQTFWRILTRLQSTRKKRLLRRRISAADTFASAITEPYTRRRERFVHACKSNPAVVGDFAPLVTSILGKKKYPHRIAKRRPICYNTF